MKLKKVDPHKIMVPEVRVTSDMDPEIEAMLKQSMTQDGLVAPIVCIETPDGLTLVDGFHRLMEAINAGWTTIDVAITEGDMQTVLTRNLYLDHLRGKHKPSEMVKVIESLWKEYQMDSEQIAAKTGLKRDYIETLQLISQLTPMCRAYLDDDKIKLGHAKALTRLKDPVQQETVLHQILTFVLTVQATNALIDDALSIINPDIPPPVPPPPPPPVKIKCAYCGMDYNVADIRNPPTCMACSGILAQSVYLARSEQEAAQAAKDKAPGA